MPTAPCGSSPAGWKGGVAELSAALDAFEHAGNFCVSVPTRSGLTKTLLAHEATIRAARGLQAAIAGQTGLTLPVTPVGRPLAGPAISLVLVGRDEASLPAAALGWELPADLGPQGYTLRIGAEGAVVAASDEAGLFYGVQTLIQIAKLIGASSTSATGTLTSAASATVAAEATRSSQRTLRRVITLLAA